MVMQMTTNNGSSGGSGGDGNRSTLELESLASVDMKKMSQSELYSLSLCSSAFDLHSTENIVIPNIESIYPSTISITTTTAAATTPSRVFAFSKQRGPRRRVSASLNDDADPQMTENRVILNSLKKLAAEGEANDSNHRRNMEGLVDSQHEVQKRKRKRKSKASEENGEEFEGLGVIKVNGEEIDLKFLARVADGAFEAELNRMTEGMVREDEFLGFLKGLEGRWGSSRKRRRYVDAADFVKALPTNWKILLSLRPRARQPSLYCRRYVSPSDIHFKSCKEVAFYLKSQFVLNDANSPQEAAMCQVDLGSVASVPKSSLPATEVELSGTNDLRNLPMYNLIKCHICRQPFTSISGLESHLQKFHGCTIQKLDSVAEKEGDPLQVTVTGHNSPMNGRGSSSLPEPINEPKNTSELTRNLKTRCMWCLIEFFHEPVDAETLASSSCFICPKCKEEISGTLETTLSRFNQPANK